MLGTRGVQGTAAVRPICKERDLQSAGILGTANIATLRFRIHAYC